MTIAQLFNLSPEQVVQANAALINLARMLQRFHEATRPYLEATARYLAKPETREMLRGMQNRLAEMQNPVFYVPRKTAPQPRLPSGLRLRPDADPDEKLPSLPHNRAGFTLPRIHDDE
jgi:hypothetical protein